jgi:hypothetical protein
MSRRHFDRTENAELHAKIDEAKRRLPLPELMRQLGYDEKHIGKTALCPFHSDHHPSFSVFQGENGWQHKCHVGCSSGDEIAFLVKHFSISRSEAISRYLDMAGFPASRPPKSHERAESREYPKPRASPQSPASLGSRESPVSPVSEGQGLETELKDLAARNACAKRSSARKRQWQLARDVKAFELRLARGLNNAELMQVFNEWFRLSQPFVNLAKPQGDYFAAFLKQLTKVRVPTGGGAITEALEGVLKLSDSDLPVIPDYADAPTSWRRIAALHRELSRRSTKTDKTYFLTCRDAAKAVPGMNHQTAYDINFALVRFGVIEIVRVGDPRPKGKASEFRFLLSQRENGAEEGDFEI